MSVHCGPSDGLGALHGRCLCYVTPADRKVPPWRREGPSERQRDVSRAPSQGGLRCTRSDPVVLFLAMAGISTTPFDDAVRGGAIMQRTHVDSQNFDNWDSYSIETRLAWPEIICQAIICFGEHKKKNT